MRKKKLKSQIHHFADFCVLRCFLKWQIKHDAVLECVSCCCVVLVSCRWFCFPEHDPGNVAGFVTSCFQANMLSFNALSAASSSSSSLSLSLKPPDLLQEEECLSCPTATLSSAPVSSLLSLLSSSLLAPHPRSACSHKHTQLKSWVYIRWDVLGMRCRSLNYLIGRLNYEQWKRVPRKVQSNNSNKKYNVVSHLLLI